MAVDSAGNVASVNGEWSPYYRLRTEKQTYHRNIELLSIENVKKNECLMKWLHLRHDCDRRATSCTSNVSRTADTRSLSPTLSLFRDIASQLTETASFITLRAKLSGAVYCNRSCLFVGLWLFVCLFVCLWVLPR